MHLMVSSGGTSALVRATFWACMAVAVVWMLRVGREYLAYQAALKRDSEGLGMDDIMRAVAQTPVEKRGDMIKEESRRRGKERATLLMLVRNEDLSQAMETMEQLEERFNYRYRYPWTLMNSEPFTERFKAKTRRIASGSIDYLAIPEEYLDMPEWVNETRARENVDTMALYETIYGDSMEYM
ncbi:hypothetical protein ABW19_dt0208554 [Dactylella cylindrospora]|nr:hypothetical protein ABW19_dt0208554 [Dactylella cylindrospora]